MSFVIAIVQALVIMALAPLVSDYTDVIIIFTMVSLYAWNVSSLWKISE